MGVLGSLDKTVYETMNFETARRVADLANQHSQEKRKLMIYLSASSYPLGFSSYLVNKWRAEEHIMGLEHLDFYSFRCGLITSEERKMLRPLGKLTSCARKVQGLMGLEQKFRESPPDSWLKGFEMPGMVEVDDIANAALYLHLNREQVHQKILENEAIRVLSEKFKSTY